MEKLSGLFAEVLSDALEYKFLWLNPELKSEMPSSSVLKLRPAKLDLTLHDLPIYIDFALKGFARFANSPEFRDEFVVDFRRIFPEYDETVGQKTANVIADRTRFWLRSVYGRDLGYAQNDNGTISTNVYTRIAINFLAMGVALNDTIDRFSRDDETSPTLVRFFDLLIFTSASFFEADRATNFWLLDEYLKLGFESRYVGLQTALRD